MHGDRGIERFRQDLEGDRRLVTSVVVEGELKFGINRLAPGKKRQRLNDVLEQVLIRLHDIIPVERSTNYYYAELKSDLWSRGLPMGDNDMWIAATALEHDLTLLTRDSHFRGVAGLVIEGWK